MSQKKDISEEEPLIEEYKPKEIIQEADQKLKEDLKKEEIDQTAKKDLDI